MRMEDSRGECRHQAVGDDAIGLSQVGIAASAPYLHDGSAQTLEDVVLSARDGAMGYTGGLSEREIQALVAYLETL